MKRAGVVGIVLLMAAMATAAWAGGPVTPDLSNTRIPAAWQKGIISQFQKTQANSQKLQAEFAALSSQHPKRGEAFPRPSRGKRPIQPATVVLPLSLTVTNTNDSGAGSLRDAIDQADGAPGSTITFDLTYPATITLTSGGLYIDSDMTITGPGADKLTIDGNENDRIFLIDYGTVSISGLDLANGDSDLGGGILNWDVLTLSDCQVEDCGSYYPGGGIFNGGTLTCTGCQVSDCGSYWEGGGIYNEGQLTVKDCCIIGNEAWYGGGIDDEVGGGDESVAAQDAPNSLVIVNSSFFFNDCYDGGGAISLDSTYTNCTMTNVTIAGNWTYNGEDGAGGGVWADDVEQATLLNTIVAYNSVNGEDASLDSDWFGGFYSAGHNLIGDTSGLDWVDGPATADQYNVDPMLTMPVYSGGTTLTAMLETGSPAIDAGDDSVLGPPLGLLYDQRGPGFPRKIGAHVDIGAFESDIYLSFFDDGEQSMACVGQTSGFFQWLVIGDPYEGHYYSGILTVYNGGTMFWSQPGASQYVYIYYDPNNHMAWGYLYDYTTGLYSSLFDSNTLNDPPVCDYLRGGEG